MTLAHIAVFAAAALVVPSRWRRGFILVASVIALFWLQPVLAIRYLDFLLPAATLLIVVVCWWLTKDSPIQRQDVGVLALLGIIALALALMRDARPEFRLTPSRPPEILTVVVLLATFGALNLGLWRLTRAAPRRHALAGMILVIIVLLVILKTEPLALTTSAWMRTQTGQQTSLASPLDLQWLGFSYIAFRLIHTLRDRQMGRLPSLSLREYVSYVLFFPALTAGPIDRAEHFAQEYRAESLALTAPRFITGGTRIAMGLLKKFVIADSLALIALNPLNAAQATSTPALWLLIYAYAFRLYFDFSGYTDIAIGIGILFGIQLPENFARPYLKPNIAAFWQSWHITLSRWVRAYVFSPLSRALLRRKVSPLTGVLIAQLVTMLTIGLWHGVSWNFALWGIWHGLGLFFHKLWSDRTRTRYLALEPDSWQYRAWKIIGIFLTFHFVTLGWVWFALPDISAASRVFAGLFGL